MKLIGVDGMTEQDLVSEVQRGGKFVIYQFCVSVVILTFKRGSDIYFVRSDESAVGKGLRFTLVSLLLGWWGIPWGPIYTVTSLVSNLKGGEDVTREVLQALGYAHPLESQAASSLGVPSAISVPGDRRNPCPFCGYQNSQHRQTCKQCRAALHGSPAPTG